MLYDTCYGVLVAKSFNFGPQRIALENKGKIIALEHKGKRSENLLTPGQENMTALSLSFSLRKEQISVLVQLV